MFNLVKNEWIKNILRPGTYIMLALIILLFIASAVLSHFTTTDSMTKSYGSDWKSEVQTDIKDYSVKLEKLGKKDPEKLSFEEIMEQANMQQELARLQFYLDKNVQPPAAASVYSSLLEISPIITFIALMVVVITGSLMSREHQLGTIKLLMIRPASRLKIFFSKYILALITAVLFTGFTYIVAAIFAFATKVHNPTGKLALLNSAGEYRMIDFWPFFWKIVGNDLIFVVIFATIAYAMSVICRNTAAAQGITLGLLFLSGLVISLLSSRTELVKYLWPANWSLNQYLTGTSPVKGMTYAFSFGYNVVAVVLLIGLAAYIFKKRDIAN
ncbi:hypothetical protein ERX27_04665 [Macrococcus brunensis]|uniref:ABC transporter permease n=1 Tax=Macrococcus brunensis TaxID=198483 RepID=A0A4R6BEQ1_9STAP|nr:ABC transporter permease subunit [Macrococcus brunensis]TDL98193.1 hypothetical protein ERX27_04665 [Macrococcus brunensis]